MHKGTAFLILEVRCSGAAHVERAVQVHVDHRTPFVFVHLVKDAIAQNAGVVDHAIDAAEMADRRLNDGRRALARSH